MHASSPFVVVVHPDHFRSKFPLEFPTWNLSVTSVLVNTRKAECSTLITSVLHTPRANLGRLSVNPHSVTRNILLSKHTAPTTKQRSILISEDYPYHSTFFPSTTKNNHKSYVRTNGVPCPLSNKPSLNYFLMHPTDGKKMIF